MASTVIIPKVDMDQDSGTISEWIKQEGEHVEKGEPLLIIETNKVAIEVESPASGILRGIQAGPGEVLPIGTVIAYILEPGEDLPETAAPQKVLAAPQALPSTAANATATPVAKNLAATHGVDLAGITGTGPRGKVTKKDVQIALEAVPGVKSGDARVYATPAARRTARERGVDLATVAGSGPKGRVQAADVLAAAVIQAQATPGLLPKAAFMPEAEIVPLQGIRRTIAERMTASYRTTPHITLTVRVDMSGFEETRSQINAAADATRQSHVSATALFVKAVAWALKRHPWLNSTLRPRTERPRPGQALENDDIHLLPEINVGVAVALKEGLIVPVIHNADQKGIGEIAAEVNDVATRAREGQLTPSDVADGTFTISNLGPFGIEQFTAIINPPQAAILAIGATQAEAIVEEGQVLVRPVMRMTLSADHRIIDGAVAAHFLADLRKALQVPALLLC